MGFAPADVAVGIRDILLARHVETSSSVAGEHWIFRADGIEISLRPLPVERAGLTLFHPRTLLILAGEGPLADRLREDIRLKFLRVGG